MSEIELFKPTLKRKKNPHKKDIFFFSIKRILSKSRLITFFIEIICY